MRRKTHRASRKLSKNRRRNTFKRRRTYRKRGGGSKRMTDTGIYGGRPGWDPSRADPEQLFYPGDNLSDEDMRKLFKKLREMYLKGKAELEEKIKKDGSDVSYDSCVNEFARQLQMYHDVNTPEYYFLMRTISYFGYDDGGPGSGGFSKLDPVVAFFRFLGEEGAEENMELFWNLMNLSYNILHKRNVTSSRAGLDKSTDSDRFEQYLNVGYHGRRKNTSKPSEALVTHKPEKSVRKSAREKAMKGKISGHIFSLKCHNEAVNEWLSDHTAIKKQFMVVQDVREKKGVTEYKIKISFPEEESLKEEHHMRYKDIYNMMKKIRKTIKSLKDEIEFKNTTSRFKKNNYENCIARIKEISKWFTAVHFCISEIMDEEDINKIKEIFKDFGW